MIVPLSFWTESPFDFHGRKYTISPTKRFLSGLHLLRSKQQLTFVWTIRISQLPVKVDVQSWCLRPDPHWATSTVIFSALQPETFFLTGRLSKSLSVFITRMVSKAWLKFSRKHSGPTYLNHWLTNLGHEWSAVASWFGYLVRLRGVLDVCLQNVYRFLGNARHILRSF